MLALAAVAALGLSACGTRLSDGAFRQSQQVYGGEVLPSTTAAPGAQGAAQGAADGLAPGAAASAGSGPGAGSGQDGGNSGSGSAGVTGNGAPGNTASDVGVTPTTITIGNISSLTNAFDPRAFTGPLDGARAYFSWLNAHGGIHGRAVQLVSCDDQGSGQRNTDCAHRLVDSSKVFAFASNAILSYAGADYVNAKGVPDVGSQPIDTAYSKYPHLWDIYGEVYPRDGNQVGYNGQLIGGTEVYRYFKTRFPNVAKKAGVVFYNQADSQRYGENLVNGLQLEGFTVTTTQVNFALPDYDSAVLKMKQAGVQYVYDALDRQGNERLCKSMDDNGLHVTAKVTTTQSWEASIGQDYDSSPTCRNDIWATGNTLNYDDVGLAQVKTFRAEMAREGKDTATSMSEWALEGWAGAMWLSDAMASCGAKLTRGCVEAFMSRTTPYDGHGLLTPRRFGHDPKHSHDRNCINVARWQDSAGGGHGGWVTQVRDMDSNCFDVPNVSYSP